MAIESRKGNDIPDALHASQVAQQPVKADAEAAVGWAPPASQIHVPIQGGSLPAKQPVHVGNEGIVPVLAHRASSQLPPVRHDEVEAVKDEPLRWILRCLPHVEGLDGLWILRDKDRNVRVVCPVEAYRLGQVPFMLTLETLAPLGRVFKLAQLSLQDVDGFSVRDAGPFVRGEQPIPPPLQRVPAVKVCHGLSRSRISGVGPEAVELLPGVALAQATDEAAEHPLNKVQNLLHVLYKAQLGLKHVKFTQVPGRIATFCPERRRKRPDVPERLCKGLEVKLRRDGQILLALGEGVLRSASLDSKGLAGSLAVGRGDDRGMRLLELLFGEELVQHPQSVRSETEHRRVERRAHAEVRNASKALWGGILPLYRVRLSQEDQLTGSSAVVP